MIWARGFLILMFWTALGVCRADGTLELKDYPLVDQDGQRARLVSQVIGDRVVVMNFIFTDCTTACPVTTAIMKAVYQGLGTEDRVRLITVTANPAVDTPARLREYAERYGAVGKRWVWLSGDKEQVDELLLSVGAYSSEVSQHPSLILVGEAGGGGWTTFYGFPAAATLLEQVRRYLAGK